MLYQRNRKDLKLVVILIISVICYFQGKSLISTNRDLLTQNTSDDGSAGNGSIRPVMHTFYEPITAQDGFDVIDSPMIKLWKEEWEREGFDTKVLTLADAKRHPYFKTMEKAVKEVFSNDVYNQYCFYRYLAMAANGGGWMSDYDTFPTNFPLEEGINLPNGGQFTSFQSQVPALISASSQEWLRVAKLMVEAIPKSEQLIKSDMMMLLDLRLQGNHNIDFTQLYVAKPHVFLKSDPLLGKLYVDCDVLGDARAIHMSHHAMAQVSLAGNLPISTRNPANLSEVERVEGAKAIMNQ